MDNIKNILEKYLLSAPVYALSLLIPRNPHIWIFIGWHKAQDGEVFADNVKYQFLAASSYKDIRAVYIAKHRKLAKTLRSQGLESYYQYSISGIWMAMRAGYTFIDAYITRANLQFTGNTKIVQLLHGKGLKKHGYGKKIHRQNDFIFGTSEFALSLLPHSFTRNSNEQVTGYARNDVLLQTVKHSDIGVDIEARDAIRTAHMSGAKVIMYTPTFRRDIQRKEVEDLFDFHLLEKHMSEINTHLFISLHPKFYYMSTISHSHVHFVPPSDVYPLLKETDLLITDYSSIFVDYLLLDRPIIFYPHDRLRYEQNEGFAVDYDAHTPGVKVATNEELFNAITDQLQNPEKHTGFRKKIGAKYHHYTDANSSQRIIQAILDDIAGT